jgi:hypothetical protein
MPDTADIRTDDLDDAGSAAHSLGAPTPRKKSNPKKTVGKKKTKAQDAGSAPHSYDEPRAGSAPHSYDEPRPRRKSKPKKTAGKKKTKT